MRLRSGVRREKTWHHPRTVFKPWKCHPVLYDYECLHVLPHVPLSWVGRAFHRGHPEVKRWAPYCTGQVPVPSRILLQIQYVASPLTGNIHCCSLCNDKVRGIDTLDILVPQFLHTLPFLSKGAVQLLHRDFMLLRREECLWNLPSGHLQMDIVCKNLWWSNFVFSFFLFRYFNLFF